MSIEKPPVPLIDQLPGGYHRLGRSEEAAEKKYGEKMAMIADRYYENVDVVHLDFTLQFLQVSKPTVESMAGEVELLRGKEPIVMSTIYLDRNGEPILAYFGYRRIEPSDPPIDVSSFNAVFD